MVILHTMKRPIYVRPLSDAERETLEAGLRSPDAFTLRGCQTLLASADGQNAYQIARNLGCNPQTARNAIHKFNEEGLQEALRRGSHRPHTVHRAFQEKGAEALRQMLHHRALESSARKAACGRWRMAAQVSFEEGLTKERVSGETVRATLARVWGFAGKGPSTGSPLPTPCTKEKRRRDRLMGLAEDKVDWVAGFEDECRWSRVTQPNLHSFSKEGEPLRLVEQSLTKDDPDPKAISCYGLYIPELKVAWLRFVDGRPVGGITTRFLEWCCQKLVALGKKVLVLIWDNASWYISREVRRWVGKHNRALKKGEREGVRIVSCLLPKKSPWLNAIEPKWIHGKRMVVEVDGLLGAYELAERVCAAFECPHYEHLSITENVA
jgi:transposase